MRCGLAVAKAMLCGIAWWKFEYDVEIDCRHGAAVMSSGSHERVYHVRAAWAKCEHNEAVG
jgi:hypothetical protein